MPAIIPQTVAAAEAVRQTRCDLCRARPGKPCRAPRGKRGDHLARWLGTYAARLITRDDLAAVIVRLVVVTKWCVVTEERAA
ncbi:MAG TPA: hypothetical protein VF940_30610 [Streptosporangiaceae bacterium]